jgi:hypothetical protein
MTLLTRICTLCFCLLSLSVNANNTVPEPLKPWLEWSAVDKAEFNCPFISGSDFNDSKNHLCAWPSDLTIELGATSSDFSLSWQVFEKTLVPLPGNNTHFPFNVTANNTSQAVVLNKGVPHILLPKGTHTIRGKLPVTTRDNQIYISQALPIIRIMQGNQILATRSEGNEIWFGENATSQESDSLRLQVSRKVSDGPYIGLSTYIELDVAGKPRQINLGKVLPEGFIFTALTSDLNSMLNQNGELLVKLLPGSYELTLDAFADQTLLNWQAPKLAAPWPTQEVWFFAPNSQFRESQLSGAHSIDPNQASAPDEWLKLAAYLVEQNTALNVKTSHRGKPNYLKDSVQLSRQLWFNFDNQGFRFQDELSGKTYQQWRYNMSTPYTLAAAQNQDGPLLITQVNGQTGVENRYSDFSITASGMLTATSELPVTGWDSQVNHVETELNLPPQTRLMAAFGVDRVSSSWLSNWNIWQCFMLMLIAVLTYRLYGVATALVSALTLVVIYQELHAPIALILNFLIAATVIKHNPFNKLASLLSGYANISTLALALAILFFAAMQIRYTLHPQLENQPSAQIVEHFKLKDGKNFDMFEAGSVGRERKVSAPSEYEMITVTGSRIKQSDLLLERYQSDAQLQVGNGQVTWQWHTVYLNWSSPVSKEQTFSIWLLSGALYTLFKLLGIALSLTLLYMLSAAAINPMRKRLTAHLQSSAAVLGVVMIAALSFPHKALANSYPPDSLLQELTERLKMAPKCAPNCATISQANVTILQDTIRINLTVNAIANTAVALPSADNWQLMAIKKGQKPLGSIRYRGKHYVLIEQGINQISVEARLIASQQVAINFADKPLSLTLNELNNWQASGVVENRLSSNSLLLTPPADNTLEGESPATATALLKLSRQLVLDQTWYVVTTISRLNNTQSAATLRFNKLKDELPLSDRVNNLGTELSINLGQGEDAFQFRSSLTARGELHLIANQNANFIENWQVLVSPNWHVNYSQLPQVIEADDPSDYFVHHFYPYPTESLTLTIERPSAQAGNTLVFNRLDYELQQGKRQQIITLEASYKSSQSGQHAITLPAGFNLKETMHDGQLIMARVDGESLYLPIQVGTHNYQISLESSNTPSLITELPQFNFNAPVANITSRIKPSYERWLLYADGPLLGAAVLYWGELLAFIVVALILGGVPFSPLKRWQWLLLGMGVSLTNWGILFLVVACFASLFAANYRPKSWSNILFNLSQLSLFALTLFTLLGLIGVVPASLLGNPDMGIDGYHSSRYQLSWYQDLSNGLTSSVWLLSVPMLIYKGLMLAWVFWLCFSAPAWLKWCWQQLGAQGFWRKKSPLVNEHNPNQNSNQAPSNKA